MLTDTEAILISYIKLLGPSSSYDLLKLLAYSTYKAVTPKPGVVYPAIKNLAKKGYLTGELVRQEPRPSKTLWSLTQNGEAAFWEWVRIPVEAESYRNARTIFEAKCSNAYFLDSDSRLRFLTSQKEILLAFKERARINAARGQGFNPFTHQVIQNFFAALDSDLAMLDRMMQIGRESSRAVEMEASRH